MSRLIYLILALVLLPAPALATTWFVDASAANDNATCMQAQSANTPKKLIASALACVGTVGAGAASGAGDTVQVAAGTYDGEDLTNLTPSGSSGNPFTLKCETDLACIFTNGNLRWTQTGTPAHAHITIRGFDFVGENNITAAVNGGSSSHGAYPSYIWEFNRFRDAPVFAWGDFSGGDDWILRHNIVTNTGFSCPAPFGPGYCHNIYVADWNRNWLIEDNDWSDSGPGYCLHIYPGEGVTSPQAPSGFIIRRNKFSNCGDPSVTGSGIVIYGENHQIYNNTIRNSNWGFLNRSFGSVLFDNNTVFASEQEGILNQGSNLTCRNNISFGNAGTAISGCNTTATNLTTDPHFVNAAVGDLHVLDTSDALGAGTHIAAITTDLDGVSRPNPPSIGAYEGGSGCNPLDPLSEDFDSYTTGISINGLNECGGWTQSWVLDSGTVTIETAPSGMTGKAMCQSALAAAGAHRLFTAHTGSFTISFKAVLSVTNPNDYIYPYLVDQAGSIQARFFFSPASGNIVTDTQTIVATYGANTVYAFDVEFDTAGHPGQYRVRANGGSFTNWEDAQSSFTSIAGIGFNSGATNTHTFCMDDISDTVGGGAGTLTAVSPGTGDKCVSGTTCLILWGSNGITGNVNLFYLVGGNAYAIAAVDVAATPYSWTVNAPAGTSAQVRVSQGAVTDDSDTFIVYGTRAGFR